MASNHRRQWTARARAELLRSATEEDLAAREETAEPMVDALRLVLETNATEDSDTRLYDAYNLWLGENGL